MKKKIEQRRRLFTSADGTRLVADEAGEPAAPRVILLHGGGQTRHSWSSALLTLAQAGYHGVNFDARGHGESDWSSDGVYTYARRVADLACILQSESTPFALVGASMGGITSLLAINSGIVPAALVLVDIALKPEREGVRRIREFMMHTRAGFSDLEEAAAAVAAYNPLRKRTSSPRGLMRNLRLREDGRLHWHWDPRMFSGDIEKDMDQSESELNAIVIPQGLPTLLVRGMLSDVISDESVAHFKAVLPTLEVANVSESGHMVAGDDNDAFANVSISFLKRHLTISN